MSGTECKLDKLKKQVNRIIGGDVSDRGINRLRRPSNPNSILYNDYQSKFIVTHSALRRLKMSSFSIGLGVGALITSLWWVLQ